MVRSEFSVSWFSRSPSDMMTDPIADMLTRIRNAQSVGKPTVVLPSSKLKRALADILVREGWLAAVEVRQSAPARGRKPGEGTRPELLLTLRYRRPGEPRITSVRRISTPGHRVYVGHDAMPRSHGKMGMYILSTPQGLRTHRQAIKEGIGGEVICELF